MNIFQSFLLGIVQGLTEFIPVSSTAHLLLVQRLLGISPDMPGIFAFNVLVQWGTLLTLVVYYWRDLWQIGSAWLMGVVRRQPFKDPLARMGWYLILGTIPALVAGALLKPLVEMLFRTQALEAIIRLLFTVAFLVVAERLGKGGRQLDSLTWKDALWVGCAQALSVFPGASRSGSTIAGGMTRQLERPAAARFAFLLSLPVMIAAGSYETLGLLKDHAVAAALLPQIAVGFVTAAVVGYLAIRWLLSFLAKRPLYVFAAYCLVLSVVMIVWMLLGG